MAYWSHSKTESTGIAGSLLNWFIYYLSNRKQRSTFSGVKSYWNSLKAGVPQGSILGPLLFLLYINDILKDIGSNIRLFAGDTSLYIVVEDLTLAAELLNSDLEKVTRWAKQYLVSFNSFKIESLLISREANKPDHPSIFMSEQKIKEADTHKHPGIFLSNDGTWHKYIDYKKKKKKQKKKNQSVGQKKHYALTFFFSLIVDLSKSYIPHL